MSPSLGNLSREREDVLSHPQPCAVKPTTFMHNAVYSPFISKQTTDYCFQSEQSSQDHTLAFYASRPDHKMQTTETTMNSVCRVFCLGVRART